MMRRYSLTPIRLLLAIAATVIASLAVATTAAQAIVVNDSGTDYGVALVPGTGPALSVPAVTTSGSCADPSLAPDLHWLTYGRVSPLCYHGGSVIHTNETYVLTWDPERRYWATTRNFIEQFLSDVATASNSGNPFGSPYALTPQYFDDGGRAQNKSIYAGGCIDYGSAPANNGGYTCRFGANHPSGTGWDYPTTGNCPVFGANVWYGQPNGPLGTHANEVVLDRCADQGRVGQDAAADGPPRR